MCLTKSPPLPVWRSGRRWLIWCGREAPSVNSSFQPDSVGLDSSRLRAELGGQALRWRAAILACECAVPPCCRAGIWEYPCSFPQDDVLQLGCSGFSVGCFCVRDSKTHLHRSQRRAGSCQAGWRLSRWEGGLLGGCCGSMEACEEERDGDDETPVFEVLSLKEK